MYMTITSGKRFEYFERMINSFFENCLDIDMINYILIVDDGSSKEDINKMYNLFFKKGINVHMNTDIRKSGQLSSLNWLFKRLEAEWFFHCEDDWEFIKKGHFIKDMLDITETDDRIKNVTLRYRDGVNIIQDDLHYKMHFFKKIKNFDTRLNNCNWYGYTLNPGLQHLPTIKRIGLYNEKFSRNNRYWDRSFALKYYDLGYRSANLCENYIKHIGEKSYYDL